MQVLVLQLRQTYSILPIFQASLVDIRNNPPSHVKSETRPVGIEKFGRFGSVRFSKTVSDPSDGFPHTPTLQACQAKVAKPLGTDCVPKLPSCSASIRDIGPRLLLDRLRAMHLKVGMQINMHFTWLRLKCDTTA
jgi:hypothetical protein